MSVISSRARGNYRCLSVRQLGNAGDKEAIKKEEKNKAGLQMFIGTLCQIEFQGSFF